MTQNGLKASIAKAFDDHISKMFGVFVSNLETQDEKDAVNEFTRGLKFSLHAHDLADSIAEWIVKP